MAVVMCNGCNRSVALHSISSCKHPGQVESYGVGLEDLTFGIW